MTAPATTSRRILLNELTNRSVRVPTGFSEDGIPRPTSEYFGINTLGVRQLRDKLPKDVYASLAASIRHGKKLDLAIAPVVAQVIKEWAISRGVTHFTHWFQPQTGLTAEKHDAFFAFDDDRQPMESFTGSQLIQSEPDASRFPSGGLRATWEARGYTAWNPASPVFIAESTGARTLCIPSVFIGYNGEALDEMTPLLRSSDILSEKSIELLELLGDRGVQRVHTTLGPEQEYFLIDRGLFGMRPDLVMGGRTLVGAPPPRGQQLEDHYFGGIGMECLLHEKPFAGINGSGKHCNCSMSVTADSADLDGLNLLKPGKTPHQNVRFLVFLAAVLKAVHKHAGLLRAGIATTGNEHRLGANEAPPAIISVFMGDMLTRMIEEIADGKASGNAEQQMIKLGVSKLPEIQRDNTDRNRTSPFAFTGQKFEYRAVGSSQSIAFPITLLNTAVADAIGEITHALRETLKKTKSVDDAVLKVVREAFKESAPVRFEGNNYAEEWIKEAKKRGLPNIRSTPDALKELISKQSRTLLTKLGVLTTEELDSRYQVRVERYVKDMLIELHTMREMVDTMIMPAAYAYLGELSHAASQSKSAGIAVIPQITTANQVGELVQELQEHREDLSDVIARAEAMHDDPAKQADLLTSEGADTMAEVRKACDALELLVGDSYWPLPKYREMLFPV